MVTFLLMFNPQSFVGFFACIQINAEFKQITTVPLQSKFLSQLDLRSHNLTKLFKKRGGQLGERLMQVIQVYHNMSLSCQCTS